MTRRVTYTLDEVAASYLPPSWTDSRRWLARRLNSGKLKGVKMGRTWVMRESDVQYMLTILSNDDKVVTPEPPKPAQPEPEANEAQAVSFYEALSPRSRARLRRIDR